MPETTGTRWLTDERQHLRVTEGSRLLPNGPEVTRVRHRLYRGRPHASDCSSQLLNAFDLVAHLA